MAGQTTAEPITVVKHKPELHYRHELKYTISSREDRLLSSRLEHLFARDKNAGADGSYQIRSLYFDTPFDTALRQKNDGFNRREKFRLRYYGEAPAVIKLEKKMKLNGLCAKQSARLTLEQAEMLVAGDYDFLLKSDQPLLIELYAKLRGQLLRPKVIVCYDREAFTYPPGNVRITLDRHLRTSISWRDFLKGGPMPLSVSDSRTVLEVKYDNFLPEVARMAVQLGDARQTAYSKYAVCRRYE